MEEILKRGEIGTIPSLIRMGKLRLRELANRVPRKVYPFSRLPYLFQWQRGFRFLSRQRRTGWGMPVKTNKNINASTYENAYRDQLPQTNIYCVCFLFSWFGFVMLCFFSSRNVPQAFLQDMGQPCRHSWCPSDFQLFHLSWAHELSSLQGWY